MAGGRGKGHFVETGFKGGVKVCDSPDEIEAMAKEMLGNHLVTNQTGPEGQLVQKVSMNKYIYISLHKYIANMRCIYYRS